MGVETRVLRPCQGSLTNSQDYSEGVNIRASSESVEKKHILNHASSLNMAESTVIPCSQAVQKGEVSSTEMGEPSTVSESLNEHEPYLPDVAKIDD